MIIIGMTGPISHGKSTFASALTELEPTTIHLESSLVIAKVANAMHARLSAVPDPYDVDALNEWLKELPPILSKTVNVECDFETIKLDRDHIDKHPIEYQKLIMHVENLKRQPELAKQAITTENKETYRAFLQWLGGYLVQKIGPGVWYKQIVRLVKEAESKGCKLCIVGGLRFPHDATLLRDAGGIIIKVYRPGHLQNDRLDPTERERDNIRVDSTIVSDGTVRDVKYCAVQVLKDINSNQLQSVYHTSHL